jgi:quinol monooxygenase YgiN
MQARILIKRKFKKGKQKEIMALLWELRSSALHQSGYISGETLVSNEDPQMLLVIGTWENLASWHSWKENETRQTLEKTLALYQEGSTEYHEYISGSFIKD